MSSADDPSGDSLGVIAGVVVAVAFIALNGLVVDTLELGLGAALVLALATAVMLGWLVPVFGIVLVVGLTFATWAATGAYFGTSGETDVHPVSFALMLLVVALAVRAGFWLVRRTSRTDGGKRWWRV